MAFRIFCPFLLGVSLASTADETNETSFARPQPVLELCCLLGTGKREAKQFTGTVDVVGPGSDTVAVSAVDVRTVGVEWQGLSQ